MFLIKSLRPTKIIEFETFFDNDSIVTTSNTPKMGRKDCYEIINSNFHNDKSFDELYSLHLENINKHLQGNSQIKSLPQQNIDDVISFQNKQNEIKRNYMKSIAWVFENDLVKSTLNDKPLVRRMIKYARELEGLESEEQIASNQAEKLLKPILENTPLEFRKKTALAIDGTEEYAWAINTNNKFSMDDWKLLKKLQPKTKRYPVITCLWQSDYQEDDETWEDNIQEAELFDRFSFEEESDQSSDDCSPDAIIQRVQYVDLEYEIKEMVDDYNLSTYSDIIETLEQNLDTLRAKFCNNRNIDKQIKKIRANIMLKIKLQQIKGEIDLERELEPLEISLYSNAKMFLPLANNGYDNYISWFEPPVEMQMVILLLPCDHAWQVPAYLHWHGSFDFNTETICALLKFWDKKYGLELICHYGTMLQIKVDKYPSNWKDAFDLAALQNIIAPNTLGPLGISIRDHAKDLLGTHEWFLHNRP